MAANSDNKKSGGDKARSASAQPVPYWANPANAEHGTCRPGTEPGTVIFTRSDGHTRTLRALKTGTPAWVRALQGQDEYMARPGKKPGDVKIEKTGNTVAWEGPAEIPYWAQSTVLDDPTHFARPGGAPVPTNTYNPRRDPTQKQKVEPVTAGAAVYNYDRLENEFERGTDRKGCGIFRRSSLSNKPAGHKCNPSGSPTSRHVHFANPVSRAMGSSRTTTPMGSCAQATPAQPRYPQPTQAQVYQQPQYPQNAQGQAYQQPQYPQNAQAQGWQQPPPMYYWNQPNNGPFMPIIIPSMPPPGQTMPPNAGPMMPPYPGY